MENKEINIAGILKGKSKGTKLYSPIIGECYLNTVNVYIISVKDKYDEQFEFAYNGNYKMDGECLLFPSKEMRDWEKFAWKKGDYLMRNDKKKGIIFNEFMDDTYMLFKGRNSIEDNGIGGTVKLIKKEYGLKTNDYTLIYKDVEHCDILTLEDKFVGKLNYGTLEIEKKPKWTPKPFDKVLVRDEDNATWVASLFSHMKGNRFVTINCCDGFGYCIPYNEDTAKLIGTAENYKEG